MNNSEVPPEVTELLRADLLDRIQRAIELEGTRDVSLFRDFLEHANQDNLTCMIALCANWYTEHMVKQGSMVPVKASTLQKEKEMNELQIMQRKVHIMGVLLGILYGYKLRGKIVIHQQLNFDVCTAAHCSYQELIDAMNVLVDYSKKVEHFLVVRNELKEEE